MLRLVSVMATVLLLAGLGIPQSAASKVDARVLLKQLSVAAEHEDGYDREADFGEFRDADGDGCDTRREVLIAEAVKRPRVGPSCSLSGGSWRSYMDGLVTSNPARLQIDHTTSLAEAWRSGAYRWSQARRVAYANDLGYSRSLNAVSAHENMSKGDQGPGQWTPDLRKARCRFVADYIAVKWRWRLSVDSFEKAELGGLLNWCDANYGGARTIRPRRA